MSEASATDLSAAPAPTDTGTNLTDGAALPTGQQAQGDGQQSTGAGEGEAGKPAGQGAGPDGAAEGGASSEAKPSGGEEGAGAQGAPDQYADFTVPDGMSLPAEMLEGVRDFAKGHKFTQEQAQGLVDLGVKQAQAILGQVAEQALKAPVMLAQHWAQEWSKQTAADAEIGGQKLKDTMALSTKVFATFATPAFGKFLNDTGLAHHPELIRFMSKVGAAVSEDTLVTPSGGQGRAPPGVDTAKKLYPDMAP